MSTSRKRTHFTNAGLATAVTLSLCLLSGCNGARFLMGADPTQPTTATNTQGQTPVGTSSNPTPMTLQTFTMKGHVDYFGEPVANAKVTLFDAITNEPAKVISAGGANVVSAGGGNVISAGGANYVVSNTARSFVQVSTPSVSTDANGDYTITFQAPANSQGESLPIRIVAQAPDEEPAPAANHVLAVSREALRQRIRGQILAKIARFSGCARYTVLADGCNTQTTVEVTPSTTIAAQNAFGVLSILKSLKTDAAVDASYGYLVELGKLTKQIEEKITPDEFAKFGKSTDSTGRMNDDTGLRTWLKAEGVDTAMDATAAAGTKSAAEKYADKNNRVSDVSVSNQDFVGSNVQIKVVDGKLVIENTATGETTTFDLGNGNTTNSGVIDQANTEEGVEDEDAIDGSTGDVVSDAKFNPTVLLTKGGSTLTVDVTQPAGSDDIAAIFARVPHGDLSGTFISSSTLTPNLAISKATLTSGQVFNLTLVQDNTLNFSAQAGPRFGNVILRAPKWQGWLQTTSGVHVAKFGVFETTGYYYLVTRFALNNAITTNSGHHTVLSVNNAALSSTAKTEYSIVSRRGAFVESSK